MSDFREEVMKIPEHNFEVRGGWQTAYWFVMKHLGFK